LIYVDISLYVSFPILNSFESKKATMSFG